MKKLLYIIILITMLLILLVNPMSLLAETDSSESAGVVDENLLELMIDYGIDTNEDGDISQGELQAFTGQFHAYNRENKITNLEGLQYLTGVSAISLGNNNISDISPLTDLSNLTSLNLYYNNISDISPLANLTNLESIHIYGNHIDYREGTDNNNVINKLEDNGTTVFYKNQKLIPKKDSPSAGIKDSILLQELIKQNLDYDNDGDISQSELESIFGEFRINDSKLSDISGLQYLTNIEYLYLDENNINDIGILSELIKLKGLSLYRNNISYVDALSNIINLQELNLFKNNISNVDVLKDMVNLKNLRIDSNNISDISMLKGLTNLESINISDNNISNIDILFKFEKLNVIWIKNNKINIRPKTEYRKKIDRLIFDGVSVRFAPQKLIPEANSPSAGIKDATLLQVLIRKGYDYNNDGDLSQSELSVITNGLVLPYHPEDGHSELLIRDLTGLQYLTGVSRLYLTYNSYESSDLSVLDGLNLHVFKGFPKEGSSVFFLYDENVIKTKYVYYHHEIGTKALREKHIYDKNENIKYIKYYAYINEYGKMLVSQKERYNTDGIRTHYYTYHDNGKYEYKYIYNETGTKKVKRYEYDSAVKQITKLEYKDNKPLYKKFYKDGKIVKKRKYDSKKNRIREYRYHDNGKYHKVYFYNTDGTKRFRYIYDVDGNKESKLEYENNKAIYKKFYEDYKIVKKRKYNSSGKVIIEYFYHENGKYSEIHDKINDAITYYDETGKLIE